MSYQVHKTKTIRQVCLQPKLASTQVCTLGVIDRLRVVYIRPEKYASQCRPWAIQGQKDNYLRATPVHDHRSNANSLKDGIQTGSQILRTHRTLGGNSARWILVSGE